MRKVLQTEKLNTPAAKAPHGGIDLFKFIAAIIVVMIHTFSATVEISLSEPVSRTYQLIVEQAVPFFFLASGYLLARKLTFPFQSDEDLDAIRRYRNRLARLYAKWMLLYTPLAIWYYASTGTPPLRALLRYVRGFFLTAEQYNAEALWYLLSSVYALTFIRFLLKKKTDFRIILFLTLAVTTVSSQVFVLMNTDIPPESPLQTVLTVISYTLGNAIVCNGFVYVAAGMFLAVRKPPRLLCALMAAGGFACNYAVSDSVPSSLLMVVTAVGIFGLVESLRLPPWRGWPVLRRISTIVYFLHMYVWTFYYWIVYGEKTWGADCFAVTALVSCALAGLWIWIRGRKRKAI